jgi:hypothetical protein
MSSAGNTSLHFSFFFLFRPRELSISTAHSIMSDWESVTVLRKKPASGSAARSESVSAVWPFLFGLGGWEEEGKNRFADFFCLLQAVNAARRTGGAVETEKKCKYRGGVCCFCCCWLSAVIPALLCQQIVVLFSDCCGGSF